MYDGFYKNAVVIDLCRDTNYTLQLKAHVYSVESIFNK